MFPNLILLHARTHACRKTFLVAASLTFTSKKRAVDHMTIFGTPVYIHVLKEKTTKLEPSGKKGIFVGYSDNSKAYRIYVLGQRYIEVSRDMIFHEEVVLRHTQELSKENEGPPSKILDSEVQREEEEFENQIPDVPKEPESPPEELLEVPPSKRRPAWYRKTVQEDEKHKAPLGTFRESIRPQKYLGLMSQLISAGPSTYKEAASQQVCGLMP